METSQNTFNGGIILDTNVASTPNSVLSNALNATITTFNGNEQILQNDMGNVKVPYIKNNKTEYACLPDGFIPIGTKVFENIMYIVSYNPKTGEGQIGTFPSPDYSKESGVLEYKYAPLNVLRKIDQEYNSPLITKKFNFDLQHPVEILAENTYDNSVNLIITDNKNTPKIINSGFAVREGNQYDIIDRYGDYNTNIIYDDDTGNSLFNLSSSLYKDTSNICKISFEGLLTSGQLQVGNYVFYVIACDKDENETGIIAESGVIPVFLGTDGDPFSVNGGTENQRTDKTIKLKITNLDRSYKYIKLYYTRTSSANMSSAFTLAYKIDKLYFCESNESGNYCDIQVTGYEVTQGIGLSELNLSYFNADVVKSQTIESNILFQANLQEKGQDKDEFESLKKYSLKIIPVLDYSKKVNLDCNYKYADSEEDEVVQNSYYSSKFNYYYTGYHIDEIYRFGIVYIRQDNSLTSVFDVLGVNELSTTERPAINVNFENKDDIFDITEYFYDGNGNFSSEYNQYGYNIKGVCKLSPNREEENIDMMSVVGIKFTFPNDTGNLLSKYKGFFFVRQKRMPTLLAQAYVTNVCEEAFVPSINLGDEVVETELKSNDNITFVEEPVSNVYKRYLYESFGETRYQSSNPYSSFPNMFPKQQDVNKSIYSGLLNNTYSRRLFTLTDYSRAYFDRVGVRVPSIDTYVSMIGGRAGFSLQQEILTYGDEQGDQYIMIKSSNQGLEKRIEAITDCTMTVIFGTKVDSIPPPSDEEGEFSCLICTEKYENIFKEKRGEWEACKLVQIPKELYLSQDKLSTYSPFYCTQKRTIDVVLYYLVDKIYYSKIIKSGKYHVDHRVYWRDVQYFEYDGNLYQIDAYCIRPDGKNSKVCKNYLFEFINKKVNNNSYNIPFQSDLSGVLKEANDNKLGISYNFDNPTFDGKYSYPRKKDGDTYLDEENLETDDTYFYNYIPMEFNSFAAFCPEYELNKAYYNNLFTGLKLVVKNLSNQKFLKNGECNRLYVFDEIKFAIDSKAFETYTLGVDEGVSLSSINHNSNYSQAYYRRRNESSYFSTKIGDATNYNFKFAGAKFLAYSYPSGNEVIGSDTNAKNEISSDFYSSNKIIEEDRKKWKLNYSRPFNLLRGIYGAYVGMYPSPIYKTENNEIEQHPNIVDRIVNIYIPNYSTDSKSMKNYFNLRFEDGSYYQPISDRYSINDLKPNNDSQDVGVCYRGDCFIGWFTHRVNRNFNDNSLPYNDEIINPSCFMNTFNRDKDNNEDKNIFSTSYRTYNIANNSELANKINLGDINAVQLGSWVTFPVRSSINISLRSTDESWTDEKHLSGNSRSFYPLHAIDPSGAYKIRESQNFNQGFNKSGGDVQYFVENNKIYLNTYYKNRITYSNILVNGVFQNGHRTFLNTHYRDYTDQYGSITKILPFTYNGSSGLLVICEHGILFVGVNERALAAESSTGNVFINTSNVLSEQYLVISNTYGSTWQESIVQTPYGIFGVDALAKKIWYVYGNNIKLISDFRIQSFLNNSLEFFNKSVYIGKCNIKTHYNSYKNDVMFTAYYYPDDSNENILWNVSWNLNSAGEGNGWQTFYSWIPSASGNIGNNFISLDHCVDKNILDNTDSIKHYFWKHGQGDFAPNEEEIKPTHWYGKQHPFEFEFAVNKNALNHKIFNNLRIISNKAKPESFHYTVEGECYDLGNGKANIYYRQELTKAFYQLCMGSNIKYNKNFLDVEINEYFNTNSNISKSTMFPLYYSRVGETNNIEDSYQRLMKDGYDYQNLSGAEIKYDPLLNQYNIVNHVKGVDMKEYGRLRGNMHYKEDGWYIQIPSINYVQKNEYIDRAWNGKLDINLLNNPLPEDAINLENINFQPLNDKFNLHYTADDFKFDKWPTGRQEMRLKDKYVKIKVRYKGDELALISGILTMYTNSYS